MTTGECYPHYVIKYLYVIIDIFQHIISLWPSIWYSVTLAVTIHFYEDVSHVAMLRLLWSKQRVPEISSFSVPAGSN